MEQNNPRSDYGFKSRLWLWLLIFAAIVFLPLGGLTLWLWLSQTPAPTPELIVNEQLVDENINAPTFGGGLSLAGEREAQTEEEAETFLGYITSMEEKFGVYYLYIDYIQWLTGDEAKEAALEDGDCTILEACAPNNFYIRNDSKKVRRLELAPDIDIRMQTYSYTPDGNYNISEKIDAVTFKAIFDKESESLLKNSPYRVEIKDGKIFRIIEKYVP
ncbi:MAG: hypothetical protein WC480_00465 [Patescibacteria group bacterium]